MSNLAVIFISLPVGFAVGVVLILMLSGSKPLFETGVKAAAADEYALSKKDDDMPRGHAAESQNDSVAAEAANAKPASEEQTARTKALTQALFGHGDVDRVRRELAVKRAELQRDGEAPEAGYQYGGGVDARSVRYSLDVCALLLIAAGAAAVLIYEYKVDPVTELAHMFPREAAALADAWSRIRELS